MYRLQNNVDLALKDLNTAIALSGGHGLAAEQAFTQRGLIYRLQGNNDQARADFQAAAKMGNKFAQKQVSVSYSKNATFMPNVTVSADESLRCSLWSNAVRSI